MSEISKQALKVENNQQFPNNNAGLITPSNLRTFNEDMIDSTVNQAVYTTDSGSFNTRIGESVVTASVSSSTVEFIKDNGETFTINLAAAGLPSGVVSGSSQIILQNTTGNLSGSRIDGLVPSASFAQTASFALNVPSINTGSYATTGSNTFVGNQTISTSGDKSGVFYKSGSSDFFLGLNGNGNLALSGSQDARLFEINKSSNWIEYYTTTNFNQGVSLRGNTNVRGINTDIGLGFAAQFDQLGASGSFHLSGSLLANLQQGYTWVGDANGKSQPFPTSSFGGGGTINTGSFATTGSNTFNGNQIINGTIRVNSPTASSESQIDYIKLPTFVGANGTTYVNNTFSLVDYASSGIDQTFFIEFANNSYEKYTALEVGPSIGGFIIGKGSGYNYDVIEIKDNNNGTSTARIKANTIQLTGSVELQNGLTASLQEGYVWVGGSGNRTITAATSSFGGSTDISSLNSFTASQQALNTTFATTGSNTFNGTQTISGSILQSNGNSDFGGNLNVQSNLNVGLVLSATSSTALFRDITMDDPNAVTTLQQNPAYFSEFIGNVLRWRENVSSGSFIMGEEEIEVLYNGWSSSYDNALYTNVGRVGVEFSDWDNAYNRTPWLRIGRQERPQFLRGLQVTGSTQVQAVTASVIEITPNVSGNGINLYQDGASAIRFYSGSNQTQVGTWVNLQTNPANGALAISAFPLNNHFVDFNPFTSQSVFDSLVRFDKGFETYTATSSFYGYANVNGGISINSIVDSNLRVAGQLYVTSSNSYMRDLFLDDPGATTSLFLNPNFNSEFKGIANRWYEGTQKAETIWAEKNTELVLNAFSSSYDNVLYFNVGSTGAEFSDWDGSYNRTPWLKVAPQGSPSFQRGLEITGSLYIKSGSALPESTGSGVLTYDQSNGQVKFSKFSSLVSSSLSCGEFWSTTTQSGSAGVSGSISFNNSGSIFGVSLNNNTQLTVTNPGTYNIQFSAQIETSAGADTQYIWFKKNGTTIADSATKLLLANNTAQVMTVNILDEAQANDYYELAYENKQGNATILYEPTSGSVPAIPSVICTITQVR